MQQQITPGIILKRTIHAPVPTEYFAYVPRQGQRHGRVFVTVHGISRNAEQHLAGFAAQAEQYGAVMLAPLFSEETQPSYQRLGVSASEARADEALDLMLENAASWLEINPIPLHIFGFSGGGQFTHRYAMLYPERVARMVLAAPGWYTFPDPEKRYPLGLRSSPKWPRLTFSPAKFLKLATLVLVGGEDDVRDDDLNKSRRIDASQGLNRVERGERWVGAMRALARSFHIPAEFHLESVPNANHAFESYLSHPPFAEDVFQYLFGKLS